MGFNEADSLGPDGWEHVSTDREAGPQDFLLRRGPLRFRSASMNIDLWLLKTVHSSRCNIIGQTAWDLRTWAMAFCVRLGQVIERGIEPSDDAPLRSLLRLFETVDFNYRCAVHVGRKLGAMKRVESTAEIDVRGEGDCAEGGLAAQADAEEGEHGLGDSDDKGEENDEDDEGDEGSIDGGEPLAMEGKSYDQVVHQLRSSFRVDYDKMMAAAKDVAGRVHAVRASRAAAAQRAQSWYTSRMGEMESSNLQRRRHT